jgi:hypothetical protein
MNYCKELEKFYKTNKYSKYRLPNFPETVSENLIKDIIMISEKSYCIRNVKSGDLKKEDKRIECKTFISRGPCSFGPKESWDEIYFLDATKYQQKRFKLYKVNLSNKDLEFQNILVNKKETFHDQAKLGRRPRIKFETMMQQIKEYSEIIFDGYLSELFYASEK